MTKIFLLILSIFLLEFIIIIEAFPQRLHLKKIITYNVTVPFANTRDFINKTSFRGGTFELREMMGDNSFSLGAAAGWHVFNEVEYSTFNEGNISITGKQYRTINSFPLLLTYHKYNGEDEEKLRTYYGGGLGMQRILTSLELGPFSSLNKQWHFALAPEAGLIYPISYRYSLLGSLKFNYAFKKSANPNTAYLSINAGILF